MPPKSRGTCKSLPPRRPFQKPENHLASYHHILARLNQIQYQATTTSSSFDTLKIPTYREPWFYKLLPCNQAMPFPSFCLSTLINFI